MLSPYTVQAANMTRMSALAEIARITQRIDAQEKETFKALLAAAPPKIRRYLDGGCVIECLLNYGRHVGWIAFNDRNTGLGGQRSVRNQLAKLRKAWKGNVDIHIRTPEPHRVEVAFIVSLPFG